MSRVYIGNLPSSVNERDIENLCGDFGQIRAVTIKNGLGLVDFDDSRDAKDAVYELNGREFCGKKAVVRIAENKQIKRKVKENNENEEKIVEEKKKKFFEDEEEEDSDDSKENVKFICTICSIRFPNKYNLKRHINNPNIHNEDKKTGTKKQKLEETSRARSSPITKRKGSNTSNDGKTTNSFSSKDTTPLRSNSIDGKDNNKADAAAVPEEKHLVENNENKVLTKKHSKLNVQDISLITSVNPSGIEGILDLVVDVVMKDGSTKSVASETLKKEAPRLLFDYYERALELKD